MQGEREKWVLNKSEIDCSNRFDSANYNVSVSGPSVKPMTMVNSERFYQRLGEFFESSGLSLVLNARDTIVDLYLVYKEVTQRGGFHQVTHDKRWDEVASAIKFEGSDSKFETQLQKLYTTLLIQFEHIFSYRSPEKTTTNPGLWGGSGTKRKHQDTINFMSIDIEDPSTRKGKCIDNSFSITKGSGSGEQEFSLLMPPEIKLMNKKPEIKVVNSKPNAPLGWRNPYQMFLKIECDRLKSIHGSSFNGKKVRDIAIESWRYLSQKDRQPYIELSRKDKERFWQEMKVYMEKQNSGSSIFDGDYHVSSQPDAESRCLLDQSRVELVAEMMKSGPCDESVSDVNWYEFYG